MCVFNVLLAAMDKSVFQLWRVLRKISNKINSFYKETSQIKNKDQTLDISCIKGLIVFFALRIQIIQYDDRSYACQGFKEILILIHLTLSQPV